MRFAFSYLVRAVSVLVTVVSGGGAGNTVVEFTDGTNKCDCSVPCAGGAGVGSDTLNSIVKATCTTAAGDGCKYGFDKQTAINVLSSNCTAPQPNIDAANVYGNRM